MIAPVPVKLLWRIWVNNSDEFIEAIFITTTEISKTQLYAYIIGHTVTCMGSTIAYLPSVVAMNCAQVGTYPAAIPILIHYSPILSKHLGLIIILNF